MSGLCFVALCVALLWCDVVVWSESCVLAYQEVAARGGAYCGAGGRWCGCALSAGAMVGAYVGGGLCPLAYVDVSDEEEEEKAAETEAEVVDERAGWDPAYRVL